MFIKEGSQETFQPLYAADSSKQQITSFTHTGVRHVDVMLKFCGIF